MEQKTRVNLEDIARAAGVSKMTVSRVLFGGPGLSAITQERVLQMAQQLAYVPNRLAAAFSSDQASTLVGICVPHLTSGLFGHMLDGVDRALSLMGYQTIIGSKYHSIDEQEFWLRRLVSWRPAGVIFWAEPIRLKPSLYCITPHCRLSRSGT